RLWPDNWGPRMEGALRAALLCLHEANQARPREEQYTLLDVVPTLSSADFREEVLKQVPDRTLWAWWRDNYDRLGRSMQQQTANPVTTKVGHFLVTEASRLVVGQSCSTFDPRSMLQGGGVLVVNSAVGLLGEGGAALVGATVLNLLGLVVEEQVALPPAQRNRLVTLVDESSTLGAADYPRMLSELGKYGASFVLVAQSLAKLDAIDDALRPTVFSNIDGLTVFQVSAQDARYLAPELNGGLEVDDLTALDDFECYARWWADGRRLPTFSLRLEPPPPVDRGRLVATMRRSAERFGRPREQVAKEIEDALVRRGVNVTPSGHSSATVRSAQQGDQGITDDTQPTAKQNPKTKARSENRDQR
ncbi:MAG TPA: type IV secretory system conjugative DNA transfer family protein, partial [Dehalococcoidia bacterium]|nr:type IV secretory system conjugative DNA transfer family protein [Dehalococcoidia bacterium]